MAQQANPLAPRLSDLPLDERRRVLAARGDHLTREYKRVYREEARPTLIERMMARVRG